MKCGKEAERTGQPDGDGRDGRRLGHGEPRPHVEKGGRIAVGSAQVDIFAARIGQHGAQFGVGHRAEQRQQAAHDPCQVDESRRADILHHLARHEEDAAADDGAHHDGSGLRAPRTRGRSGALLCRGTGVVELMR